jgi:hypothetical protein
MEQKVPKLANLEQIIRERRRVGFKQIAPGKMLSRYTSKLRVKVRKNLERHAVKIAPDTDRYAMVGGCLRRIVKVGGGRAQVVVRERMSKKQRRRERAAERGAKR